MNSHQTRQLTRRQLLETCYHEAGHVVASRTLGGRVEEVRVAIDRTVSGAQDSASVYSRDGETLRVPLGSLADMLVVSLAGLEAQFTLLRGNVPTAADYKDHGDGDYAYILNFVNALAAEGHDPNDVFRIAVLRARELILNHTADVRKLARVLIERGRLTGEQLDEVLGPMSADNGIDGEAFAEMLRRANIPLVIVEDSE
jgi:hypothetical protein